MVGATSACPIELPSVIHLSRALLMEGRGASMMTLKSGARVFFFKEGFPPLVSTSTSENSSAHSSAFTDSSSESTPESSNSDTECSASSLVAVLSSSSSENPSSRSSSPLLVFSPAREERVLLPMKGPTEDESPREDLIWRRKQPLAEQSCLL